MESIALMFASMFIMGALILFFSLSKLLYDEEPIVGIVCFMIFFGLFGTLIFTAFVQGR